MFGASRKKFVEGVDGDYHDENMYYSQSSMFPHRSEKDVSWINLFSPFNSEVVSSTLNVCKGRLHQALSCV